jgi:hypothetical protein
MIERSAESRNKTTVFFVPCGLMLKTGASIHLQSQIYALVQGTFHAPTYDKMSLALMITKRALTIKKRKNLATLDLDSE